MSKCDNCGKTTSVSFYLGNKKSVCPECHETMEENRILTQSNNVNHASDFKDWGEHDLSELFWIHLGKYKKEPNPESLKYINMAFAWACHASHGLSSSFYHAMKWADIDLYTEQKRWKR